jgi:hypothetical protein
MKTKAKINLRIVNPKIVVLFSIERTGAVYPIAAKTSMVVCDFLAALLKKWSRIRPHLVKIFHT